MTPAELKTKIEALIRESGLQVVSQNTADYMAESAREGQDGPMFKSVRMNRHEYIYIVDPDRRMEK